MSEQIYRNWRVDIDDRLIAWLTIDRADATANTLNREVLEEFEQIIYQCKSNKLLTGIIIRSGKKSGFIAGADIQQFQEIKDREQAYALARYAQEIFNRLSKLPQPSCAMIHGFCLGGGYELALACDYRVATDDLSTRIGLPEAKLGLCPGFGGTVRLPLLIGPINAMKIILPGKDVAAKKAKKLGMIDAAVPQSVIENAAIYYIEKKPKQKKAWFTNSALMRPFLANQFRRKLEHKVKKDHYPAPYAVVDNWQKDGCRGDAMENEAKTIADLIVHPTSRELVKVFFKRENLKKLTKTNQFKAKRVHVIGAGTMGEGIASWCAAQGLTVTIQDRGAEYIAPAIKRAYRLFQEVFKKPNLVQAAMDRLQPDVDGSGIENADVIIEAVFEDLAVKREVFKEVLAKRKKDALIATNTSSIPLQEIEKEFPELQLVGLHFFNPVAKMPLLEIVTHEQTDQQILEKSLSFAGQLKKLPLPVASSPGFLVNRVLMPYLLEAVKILEEGGSAEQIDRVAENFGMPMGPIALADQVGLDVCFSVAKNLTQYYGGEIPKILSDKVAAHQYGVKSKQGFYRYRHGKAIKANHSTADTNADWQDRIILSMANTAVACLDEKVVDSVEHLDSGMIFGTGFAPFRGGLLEYVHNRGIDNVKSRLSQLAQMYGDRFLPHPAWDTLSSRFN